ncbi:hypothetical protein ACGDLY_001260 [Vibrio campbellii]
MRLFITLFIILTSVVSFHSTAASVTVKWIGKVPSLDCASRPVSNQIEFEKLNAKCRSEFVNESSDKNKVKSHPANIVKFDI